MGQKNYIKKSPKKPQRKLELKPNNQFFRHNLAQNFCKNVMEVVKIQVFRKYCNQFWNFLIKINTFLQKLKVFFQ